MNKEEIILIGGGGHCKACIDVIEQEAKFDILGIIDIPDKIGEKILQYSILWTDSDLISLSKIKKNFFITIGYFTSNSLRINLFNQLKRLNVNIPIIISPYAYVSKYTTIGEGTIIMHKALVNADVKIGNNCIINSQALVEHETIIGNNTQISTGAKVNGKVSIGNNCFIGSNAVIINNISITSDVIIGAGAVVINDIDEKGIYVGNPAKKIK